MVNFKSNDIDSSSSGMKIFVYMFGNNSCDESVIMVSTMNNKVEKDNLDNLSLTGDGFNTVMKAKAVIDAIT
ncbi:Peroxidase 50 [Dendrobium catenatum]|uniref:Peroxidase 50 n=1 Tax=Dendrobium catenatum TaxID=906689 RepID=A0A2I0XGK9_9ASPA|nr:Peroxidase 50 [Dendrobium catenatum]